MSWSTDQDRSAKAINRTADMNVQEKSDCAVVSVNQPNNEGQLPSAEAGEGGAQTEENIVQSHMRPTRAPVPTKNAINVSSAWTHSIACIHIVPFVPTQKTDHFR